MYKVFDEHGRRGINSAADDPLRRMVNMQLALKRHLLYKASDCAVMIKHHTHKLIVANPKSELGLISDDENIKQIYTHLKQDDIYIHPNERYYGNAGSFLRLYTVGLTGYAERAEYDPLEIGCLVLVVRDRKIISLDPVYFQI
jgi:hypothetical protein